MLDTYGPLDGYEPLDSFEPLDKYGPLGTHEPLDAYVPPDAPDVCAPLDAYAALAMPEQAAPECPEDTAPAVHGYILTPDGEPIHGVTLTLLAKSGRQLDRVSSRADGAYALLAPAPGVYLLAATAPGYASRARHIMLGEGPLTYDLELVEAVGTGRPARPPR
ncbi:carboxypeptidase-like regulatory domain-containing protein [Streptomyces sp. G45]|uniref:carboxypeptidase-like regulatory domain-containing protein n=1 Tax=Streptomyces sp. G45 TaxID=3406627 RepID=UPI003C20A6E2